MMLIVDDHGRRYYKNKDDNNMTTIMFIYWRRFFVSLGAHLTVQANSPPTQYRTQTTTTKGDTKAQPTPLTMAQKNNTPPKETQKPLPVIQKPPPIPPRGKDTDHRVKFKAFIAYPNNLTKNLSRVSLKSLLVCPDSGQMYAGASEWQKCRRLNLEAQRKP